MKKRFGARARAALSGFLISALAVSARAQPAPVAAGGSTALTELLDLNKAQGGSYRPAGTVATFNFPTLALGAQTGGAYAPPPGADLSKAWTRVALTCNADKSVAGVALDRGNRGGQLIFTGIAFNPQYPSLVYPYNHPDPLDPLSFGALDLTINEAGNYDKWKFELDGQNKIAIRDSLKSPWIVVGELAAADLANICRNPPADKINPNEPDATYDLLAPVTLLPEVRFSFTRSMGMSLCLSLPDGYARSRFLIYKVSVSALGGASQTFTVREEVIFPDKSSCQNWKEAPWVPK